MTSKDEKPNVFIEDQKDTAVPDLPSENNPVHATLLDQNNVTQAKHDDLARNLETLVNDADDWAQLSNTNEARAFSSQLRDLYRSFTLPLEQTGGAVKNTPQSSGSLVTQIAIVRWKKTIIS